MQYSDTSGKSGLLQDCEFWTGLGDAGITGNATLKAQFTSFINRWYHKTITMILESQDDWDFDDYSITSTAPIATRAMVAARRDYSFNSANWSLIGREGGAAGSSAAIFPLKVSRVDVTYDGTNYYKAEPFDSQQTGLGLGNDTNTDGRFSTTSPFYDIRNNALWIYPLASAADVTAGAKIRVTFFREPAEFATSDTTKEPGFDEAFHRMLSIGASLDWALAKSLPVKSELAALLQDYERRLKQHYGNKDTDVKYQLTPAYQDYN